MEKNNLVKGQEYILKLDGRNLRAEYIGLCGNGSLLEFEIKRTIVLSVSELKECDIYGNSTD